MTVQVVGNQSIRLGPCRVCDRRRGVVVSAPGFPGGLRIGCPRCTQRGVETLLALIATTAPEAPGGVA